KGQPVLTDWPLFRGDASRSAKGKGEVKSLGVKWKRSMLQDNEDGIDGKLAEKWVLKALQAQDQGKPQPIVPGACPIVTDDLLIYRSYAGVTALCLQERKDGNLLLKPGDYFWRSTVVEGSLTFLLDDIKTRPTIDQWLGMHNAKPGGVNFV